MDSKDNGIGETGLQFFGKMTASISHEIKNVLAIISEHAGILEDLAFMQSSKGIPLDPEKVGSVSKKVAVQIQRADGIIKRMNKFAHSVDQSTTSVDICDVVALVAALSERFAANKGVTLETQLSDSPVIVITHPFYLENLVWHLIVMAMEATGKDKKIGLVIEGTDSGAVIRFTNLSALAETGLVGFPDRGDKVLLEALNARLTAEAGSEEIVLTLPAEIGGWA